MGMFSWDCRYCGGPLLSVGLYNDTNGWMSRGVVLTPDGHLLMGEYDGYGRIGLGVEIYGGGEPECYHQRCWERVGMPQTFTGASKNAESQGFIFEPGEFDYKTPDEARKGILGLEPSDQLTEVPPTIEEVEQGIYAAIEAGINLGSNNILKTAKWFIGEAKTIRDNQRAELEQAILDLEENDRLHKIWEEDFKRQQKE